MSAPQRIRIAEYDYPLPDERIAKYPIAQRDQSKLLVYRNGEIKEDNFFSLPEILPADSLLVFNNTKVIQARMHFTKATGALIEIFCLEPYAPHDYALIFQQTQKCVWNCLVGNSKKWKEGSLEKIVYKDGQEIKLTANRLEVAGESNLIEFEWNNPAFTFADLLEVGGELPIPPYLNRKTEEQDKQTYQTVYSKIIGSVAAPTAGLHFTKDVFNELGKRGISTTEVTLHVGAGTFKPVKSETIEEHNMHSEFISVTRETIQNLRSHKGKIIAVGTTSVRTLESLYYIGELLEQKAENPFVVSQWQPYQEGNNLLSKEKALDNILSYLDANNLDTLFADTKIIIAPGYQFKIVEGMVTNFHQPKSTLLLLVSAFIGEDWKKVYEHALENDFRFLSYGDSSLLLKD